MKWVFSFVLILLIPGVRAQDITAYSDIREYFYVFDKGITRELEYLPVKSYKTGWEILAYVANSGALKVYDNTKTYELLPSVTDYYVSKYLVLGKLNNQIKIFDKGKMLTLSSNAGTFKLGDSIAAFHDKTKKTFNAYYKGEIIQLEDLLSSPEITNFKVEGNIIAYIDAQDYFSVFYHGENTKLLKLNDTFEFVAGQDVVAYYNNSESTFHVFYKGENYTIEDFAPLSYSAGSGCVAYVDNLGKFKIFKDGQVMTISDNQPDFYKVKDEMVVYSEQGFLKVYYKGSSFSLENYIPESYKYDQASVAYTDKLGSLKLFQDGKPVTVTYENVKSFDLNGDLLKYVTSNNTNKIFYKGKTY
jgi:hypothetical protein